MAAVSIPPVGISSSDLRLRLAEGRTIRYMVPRGVEAYIDAHGLYRDASDRIGDDLGAPVLIPTSRTARLASRHRRELPDPIL